MGNNCISCDPCSCSGVMSRWRRTWRLSIRSWRRDGVSLRTRDPPGKPSSVSWSSRKCMWSDWFIDFIMKLHIIFVQKWPLWISKKPSPQSSFFFSPTGVWKRIRRKGRSFKIIYDDQVVLIRHPPPWPDICILQTQSCPCGLTETCVQAVRGLPLKRLPLWNSVLGKPKHTNRNEIYTEFTYQLYSKDV